MAKIQLLPPEEALKIAAGEVIDRPSALVREFIDNAIDAGGDLIEVAIEGGGAKRVEISDDGCGMEYDDLELACLTHATSKIHSIADLAKSRALGFRGEALAAAAAVSRLEILTSTGSEAWILRAGPNSAPPKIEPARRTKGTSVRSIGLFDTIPARKRFLKRESSEALLCRQIFLDKAMAFPARSFKFVQDGNVRYFFSAANTFKERFIATVLENRAETAFLHEIHAKGEGFGIKIIVGGPEIYRVHRREQFIFANGRRINDYSLQQALEYGSQGAFPNGTHPIGAIFLDIDPALADFNVHPAKREAKFSCAAEIHHAISSTLRMFFHNLMVAKVKSAGQENVNLIPDTTFQIPSYSPAAPNPKNGFINPKIQNLEPKIQSPIKYIGTAFNLFILVEDGDKLLAIDQHAAHERILYNKLISRGVVRQELLAPIPFTTSSRDEDVFLEGHRESLAKLGIVISGGNGSWHIEALPALWRGSDLETVRAILDLKNSGENLAEKWAAALSCHSAIRDGNVLDDESALELAREALSLPVHACPHGRPFVTEIKKEALLQAVRRT